MIYLAASYGHLGRIKEGDAVIEAANDLRDQAGMGDLSLERDEGDWFSPFQGEIDFKRFGGRPAQERVRAGLTDMPALKWQYLVTPHEGLGAGDTWWEVEGATLIDVTMAKSMYDRGVVFVFADHETAWKAGHIPGTVHLPRHRRKDPTKERLTETTLMEIVDKSEEVVFYGGKLADYGVAQAAACAKALTWGFTRVYYFGGGLRAWNKAGYPVETAQ